MTKEQWKKKSKAWKRKSLKWKGRYLGMQSERNEWRKDFEECAEALEEREEDPDHNLAIESLEIENGKFVINGEKTQLIGAYKREGFIEGAGSFPKPVNYTYKQLKSAFFKSKSNYCRVLAPLDLDYFRSEVIDYLNHGKVVEVELYNAGKSSCEYQAHWKDTFNAVKDLPIIFDACNEFMDYKRMAYVSMIVDWVVNRGGLVSAGAWGLSNYGEEYAKQFMAMNNRYQIKPHHQRWTKASIDGDREPGKPMLWNELHTRDNNLTATKRRLKLGYEQCEGVQVYSLLNFGMGAGSNFQAILDYIGELVK